MVHFHQDEKSGFIGGCVLAIFKSIALHHVIETVVYAIIGTVVSFFVSMLLRYLRRKIKKSG